MLRNPAIRALLSAEVISNLGSRMTWLALPWFVLVSTGSATRMGFVFAAEAVPIALLGIPGGTVVQRFGARNTMLVCDLVRAPLVALVPLLHALHALSFATVLVLVFLAGVFTARTSRRSGSSCPRWWVSTSAWSRRRTRSSKARSA